MGVKSKQSEKSLQTLQLFRHPSQKSGCCQRGVERWKRLSYWTAATRKHCLLGTAGQLTVVARACQKPVQDQADHTTRREELATQSHPTPSHGVLAIVSCWERDRQFPQERST